MSDFGTVLEYAMQLEAEMPVGTLAKFEEIRPASMGPTKKQREEMARGEMARGATPAPTPTPAAAADDKRR